MNKIFLIIFILSSFTFSQNLFESNQKDSSQSNNSEDIQLFGSNLMFSNYVFGVEEDNHLGDTYGLNFDYKLIYPFSSEFNLNVGWLIINQESTIGCEHVEEKKPDFNQVVFYFKADYSSYYNHLMYKIGIAFNTNSEVNTVCHNEIYFHPILVTYELGIGDIDKFYFNFGINNDFEINKSHGTYGLFSGGINYIINTKDFIRINYYFNRDNFHHEKFYNGWILKSHKSINEKYGMNINFYYSNYIKGYSLSLGLTYVL